MMIADHTISDRNNDGKDSLEIWNDLMATNNVQTNPFGIIFDYADILQTSNNVVNLSANQILHGPILPVTCSICGNVTAAKWSNGTTMTINPTVNSSVTGLIFKTGSSTTGTKNVMCASATFVTSVAAVAVVCLVAVGIAMKKPQGGTHSTHRLCLPVRTKMTCGIKCKSIFHTWNRYIGLEASP